MRCSLQQPALTFEEHGDIGSLVRNLRVATLSAMMLRGRNFGAFCAFNLNDLLLFCREMVCIPGYRLMTGVAGDALNRQTKLSPSIRLPSLSHSGPDMALQPFVCVVCRSASHSEDFC